jgi:cell division protein FtsB
MAGVAEIRRRAGEAYRWFRAFPALAQILAVVGLLLVGLALLNYATGAVTRTTEHVRAWWFDWGQAQVDEAVAEKQKELDRLAAERDALRTERDIFKGQRDALARSLEEQGADGETIRKELEDDYAEVEKARAGDPDAPVDRGALIDGLRRAYKAKRR